MGVEHLKKLIEEIQMCIMDNSLRCHNGDRGDSK